MNAVAMMRDINGCGHHHHHHGDGEAEEYGIGTFVYFRRRPFNFEKFDRFVNLDWPANVIRTKGECCISATTATCPCFSSRRAYRKTSKEAGYWYATAPEEELMALMDRERDSAATGMKNMVTA